MEFVEIHSPDSFHPSLSAENFDIRKFMGTWCVAYSTLPLWKNKKDVTITYTPFAPDSSTDFLPRLLCFKDVVEYRAEGASYSSKPSRVEGIDTLLPAPSNAPSHFSPAASYKWRGKGLLMIVSSHWQFLGYSSSWAVTYFSKTLFTPAGIDIYVRDGENGLSEELYDEIMRKLAALGGNVGDISKGMFEVKRSARGRSAGPGHD